MVVNTILGVICEYRASKALVACQACAAAGTSCIHDVSASHHHQLLGWYSGNLTDACAVISAHRGKLYNAVALCVEACGLQIESHQGSHELQAASIMSYRRSLSEERGVICSL